MKPPKKVKFSTRKISLKNYKKFAIIKTKDEPDEPVAPKDSKEVEIVERGVKKLLSTKTKKLI